LVIYTLRDDAIRLISAPKATQREAEYYAQGTLDQDVVDYFKQATEQSGALPYQTQINQTLRRAIESEGLEDIEALKARLLEDPEFLRKLAKYIKAA